MEKLQELIQKCKCSVSITVNGHRDYYQNVVDHIRENPINEIEPDVLQKMIETDTIIELQYYPNTPIGFMLIYHYDIENAIDIALKSLE